MMSTSTSHSFSNNINSIISPTASTISVANKLPSHTDTSNIQDISNKQLVGQKDKAYKQDESFPFRITTLNVRGLNDKAKQELLLDTINKHNIQLMGVSETNLNEKASKLIYKRNRAYKAYFAADDEQSRGAGVGIIITKQYDKYTKQGKSCMGRATYIDLYIRGRQNIRIIQTYIHANHKERASIEKLYKEITSWMEDAKKNHMEIIIMGDFNIKYKSYLSVIINQQHQWKYSLFAYLDKNNIWDSIPIFNEHAREIFTFKSSNQNLSPSRVDYIFASYNIMTKALNSTVIDVEHFDTDHRMVTLSLITDAIFKKKN